MKKVLLFILLLSIVFVNAETPIIVIDINNVSQLINDSNFLNSETDPSWTNNQSSYYNITHVYNKTQVDNNFSLYLLLTDQRYNETSLINNSWNQSQALNVFIPYSGASKEINLNQKSITNIKNISVGGSVNNAGTFTTSNGVILLGDESNSREFSVKGISSYDVAQFDSPAYNVTLAGEYSGSAGIFKDGTSTVKLATSGYAGDFTGNVLVSGSISASNLNPTGWNAKADYQFKNNNFNGSGDINTTGNINTTNVTASYFKGDGSLLTGIASGGMDYTNLVLTNKSNTYSNGFIQDFGDNNLITTGSIKNSADNSIHYFGAADDAELSFTGSDFKIKSNAITSTDGLILQQQAIAISSDGTVPTDTYPVTLIMDATSTRGLYIDGATNDFTGTTASYGLYIDREYDFGTGIFGSMRGMYFDIEHLSSNASLIASKENIANQMRITETGKVSNQGATNLNYYDTLLQEEFYGTGTFDTTSTGRIAVIQRGSNVNFVQAPVLTDSGGNSPASFMNRVGTRISIGSNPTISSGAWYIDDLGLDVSLTSTTARNQYGLYSYNFGGGTGNGYFIYGTGTGADSFIMDNVGSGTSLVVDVDNKKIQLGETNTDMELYSDGTNAVIKSTGVVEIRNATGYGTLKLGSLLYGSSVFDKSKGNATDMIKDSDEWRTPDGKVNYSAHYASVQTKVPDRDNCWEVIEDYCWTESIQICDDQECKINNETICSKNLSEKPEEIKDYDTNSYEECGTKLEWGFNSELRINTLEQSIAELKLKNQELENRLKILEEKIK